MPASLKIIGLLCLTFTLFFTSSQNLLAIGPAGVEDGLKLWFSANSGVKDADENTAANGEVVETWDDQSDDARTATRQSGGATYSTSGLNYNPTLEFDSSNYTFSDTGLPAGSSDRSIFVVASTNDTGGWRYVLGAGTFGGNNGFDFGNRAGSGTVFITTHSAQEAQTGSWSPLGTARLAYGSVTSSTLYLSVNGGALESGGSGVNTVLDGSANIGANSGGVEQWYGSISEVIMFSRTVSDIERQRINSYLALKYGFSLDQSTPQSYLASGSNLMWDKDASGASTYDNGLFGIGRDDDSNLAQLKSRGQTSTNIIILEAEDEGVNGDPEFDDIDNLEFLVIGDNGGAASWTTTGAPTGFSILSKQWKKQEAGDVGRVTMDFDVADSDFDVPDALDGATYYFIYDTDNDQSLADETPLAMSDQGSNLWRTTVDFGSGGLFTLASTDNPAILSLSPADNATDVSLNSNLVITFSRSVTANTGNITIRKSSDNSVFETIDVTSGQVTGGGTSTITINSNLTFAGNTGYYLEIGSSAFEDVSNNLFGGISSAEAWNFITINTPSPTPTPTPTSAASNNDSQSSSSSSTSSTSCSSVKPPIVPDLFQIDVSHNKAVLYFTPLSHDVTNYLVTYGYTAGEERFGVYTELGASTGVLAYTIHHLDKNMDYYFKVQPHNGCASGDWSNIVKVTTTSSPSITKEYYRSFIARVRAIFPHSVTQLGTGTTQVLGAATSASQSCEYQVQSGDTLWDIASLKFNSSLKYKEIMQTNGLQSDLIKTGQILKIGC